MMEVSGSEIQSIDLNHIHQLQQCKNLLDGSIDSESCEEMLVCKCVYVCMQE